MSEDEVESFTSLFAGGYCAEKRVEKRLAAEKRSAMSARQRKRGAIRTAQINFRCSPEFKRRASELAARCDASIADVMEEALALLERTKGREAA